MRSNLSGKKVVIFGGTGFIGSHLVKSLCKEACQIRIISRKLSGVIALMYCMFFNEKSNAFSKE